MAALERLKARRAGTAGGNLAAATAATAHRQSSAYLAAFDGPGQELGSEELGATQPSCTGHPLKLQSPAARAPAFVPQRSTAATTSSGGGEPWRKPPTEVARVALSDRNLLCASVDWVRQEAVLGSADHAIYAVDLQRRRKARTLYGKRAGHREWVTAVCHLPGHVASGGMDSLVCLWPCGPSGSTASSAGACKELAGHAGPVSQLEAVPMAPGCLVSASYDKRLLTWNAATARQQQVLAGHCAPVLQLRVADAAAASGDRQGAVICWDLAAGKPVGKPLPAHTGHCTALEWMDGSRDGGSNDAPMTGGACAAPLLLSGGQDSCVRLWDCRAARQLAQQAAHVKPGGRGAVGSIAAVGQPGAAQHLIVTAGADCTVQGLDGRRGLEPVWSVPLPDFPYTMTTASGAMVLVGCGDGSVLIIDAATGAVCCTLHISTSAVCTLHAGADLLVAGCDDGSAVLYAWAS